MWSIVSGCGVPLKNPMIMASFVSAMASSDRNISCRSKFLVQNCACFWGSLTARLKCQTVPSCIFIFIPPRNASSALVPADDAILTHAQAVRKREKRARNGTLLALEEHVNAGLDDARHPKTFFVHSSGCDARDARGRTLWIALGLRRSRKAHRRPCATTNGGVASRLALGPLKTKASLRTLELPELTLRTLRASHSARRADGTMAGSSLRTAKGIRCVKVTSSALSSPNRRTPVFDSYSLIATPAGSVNSAHALYAFPPLG